MAKIPNGYRGRLQRLAGFWGGCSLLALAWITPVTGQSGQYSGSASFTWKDWDLVCDNTLTCRAVGYSAEDAENSVSVLLTRAAGPSTPVHNQVMLAEVDDEKASAMRGAPSLFINNHDTGKLQTIGASGWQMDAIQFAAFFQALRHDSLISFKDNTGVYTLSGAGASAVLLKMDDIQGRIDTVGALVKKGQNPESDVAAPIAAPVIVKAPVTAREGRDLTAQESAFLKPLLIKDLESRSENRCEEAQLDSADLSWQIASLNGQQSVVIAPCWMAAYNMGDVVWVISNDMKTPPHIVTDSASNYQDGEIYSAQKGRGLGDCFSTEAWVWDGKQFVHSEVGDTGRCLMIRGGGTWELPTLVSHIVNP